MVASDPVEHLADGICLEDLFDVVERVGLVGTSPVAVAHTDVSAAAPPQSMAGLGIVYLIERLVSLSSPGAQESSPHRSAEVAVVV